MGRYYEDNPTVEDTFAPYKRTVGMEVEIASAGGTMGWLYERGHTNSNRLHGYQCRCSEAQHYPIHPTSDGTAPGGEYIIGGEGGVVFGSPKFLAATKIMEEALVANRAGASNSVGSHTHVGIGDFDETRKKLLLRNYLAYQEDILALAAASFPQVRSNGCTSPRLPVEQYIAQWANANRYTTGTATAQQTRDFWNASLAEWRVSLPNRPTFNFGRGYTIEFRVWNTSRVQWRMLVAAGVSSAFVEAANENRIAQNPADSNRPSLVNFLEGLLTTDMLGLVKRQQDFHATRNR